jgi:phosphoribosylformylglycinamidine synthase
LLASPDLCSREDVTRTYDTMVGTNTLVGPGSDAAVLRIRGADDRDTGKAIALATDGNGRLTGLDPFNGGALAVAEAARNVVCSGARPLALTNCLNFGNPEKPSAYYQLERAISGMAEAARALGTPVISGNVSLYNESFGAGIAPTPVVGMLGVIEGRTPTPSAFQGEGHIVALAGELSTIPDDLNGGTYLAALLGVVAGRPPQLDLERERAVQAFTLAAVDAGLVASAHDCSDGGLAVALAECCMWSGLGFTADEAVAGMAGDGRLSATALLFGEAPSRIVLSVSPESWDTLCRLAMEHGVSLTRLGVVAGDQISISGLMGQSASELRHLWRTGLARALASPAQVENTHGAGSVV